MYQKLLHKNFQKSTKNIKNTSKNVLHDKDLHFNEFTQRLSEMQHSTGEMLLMQTQILLYLVFFNYTVIS